jgi:hypothetical protein
MIQYGSFMIMYRYTGVVLQFFKTIIKHVVLDWYIILLDDDGRPRFLAGISTEYPININVTAKFCLKTNKSITFIFGKLIYSTLFLYSNNELQVTILNE